MTPTEVKILYKVYFRTGIIPIKERLRFSMGLPNEYLAMICFVSECNARLINPEMLLDKIGRYSLWKQKLSK